MRKFYAILASLVMVFALFSITPAASATTCHERYVTTYKYFNVDEPAVRSFAVGFVRVFFKDCGSYNLLNAVQYGYLPDRRYNDHLDSGLFRAINMNISPIIGINYGNVRMPFYKYGVRKTQPLFDRKGIVGNDDLCTNSTIDVDKIGLRDWHFTTRYICAY